MLQEFATADQGKLLPDCLFLTMKKQKLTLTAFWNTASDYMAGF